MIRVTGKTRHHSRDEIVRMVDEATGIADQLGLSDADRQTLLPGILNLCSATHIEMEQVAFGLTAAGGPAA